MNYNEFEAWLSRNVKNVGKGGSIPSIDPFNKAKIGSERNKRPEEFPMNDVEEYHHYNERYKPFSESDDDKSQNGSSDSQSQSFEEQSRSTSYSRSKAQKASKASRSAGNVAKSVVRNIISKVVLVVVGSVVVVSGYNAVQAHEAEKAAPPVVTAIEWQWDDAYSSATAELLDAKGALIETVPAAVTTEEIAATCTAAGTVTYTATYTTDDGTEHTDTKTVTHDAIGHAFEKVGEDNDGETVTTTFECTHCHEQFTITTSVEEEDD